MNRKTIISIVVIVVGFGGAAFILINHFAGGGSSVTSLIQAPSFSNNEPAEILPYGTQLNFKPVLDYGTDATPFKYPVLNPGTVGIPADQLLKGPPAGSEGSKKP